MTSYKSLFAIAAVVAVSVASNASAQVYEPQFYNYASALGGNSQVHTWAHFYDGVGGNKPAGVGIAPTGAPPHLIARASQWPQGIAASTGAVFGPDSTSGSSITYFSPVEANGGIYTFNTTALFNIRSEGATPISDLGTLLFEIGMTENAQTILSADLLVTHSGGADLISYDFTRKYGMAIPSGSPDPAVPDDIVGSIYGFQFDVSGFTGITAYNFLWEADIHTNTYGVQATEVSGSYGSMVLIPEPSSFALLAAGAAGLAFLRRRRAA